MITTPVQLISNLRAKGERITTVRSALIEVFLDLYIPQTVLDLKKSLKKRGIIVNKTTIYRELDFLRERNIIQEIEFGDGKTRYELAGGTHHHHLICKNCHRVSDIELHNEVNKLIEQVTKQGFAVADHYLEFFGLCAVCAKLKNKKGK